MNPCNSCEAGNCGSCIADRLERDGYLRNAKDHCGCAEFGHKNTITSNRPKVKSMLGMQKNERDIATNTNESEVVEE